MNHGYALISVIVAVFNGGRTLQQCIDSVAGQTYKHIQLIIIDGGSTDDTVDIIHRNADKIDFTLSEKDRGIYDAWNKGLSHVRGDWICFLGSDDYFYDCHVIERMVERLASVPEDRYIAYGRLVMVDDQCQPLHWLGEDWDTIKCRFSQMMCIAHPAVFHRKALFEKYGKFDDTFRIAGDYEMLMRVLKDGDAYSILDVVVVAMRNSGVSSKRENAILSLKEIRAVQKMHGQKLMNRQLMILVTKAYLKKALSLLLGARCSEKVSSWWPHAKALVNERTKTKS